MLERERRTASEKDSLKNLKAIAAALRSAREQAETGRPLTDEELRALRLLQRSRPQDEDSGLPPPPRTFLLTAAIPVLASLGLLIPGDSSFTSRRPDAVGRSAIPVESTGVLSFAMQPIGVTRIDDERSPRDRFVLDTSVPNERFLYVVPVDARRKADLVFRMHDDASGTWSFLGYEDNRLSGDQFGGTLSIPAQDFAVELAIEVPEAGRAIRELADSQWWAPGDDPRRERGRLLAPGAVSAPARAAPQADQVSRKRQ